MIIYYPSVYVRVEWLIDVEISFVLKMFLIVTNKKLESMIKKSVRQYLVSVWI